MYLLAFARVFVSVVLDRLLAVLLAGCLLVTAGFAVWGGAGAAGAAVRHAVAGTVVDGCCLPVTRLTCCFAAANGLALAG